MVRSLGVLPTALLLTAACANRPEPDSGGTEPTTAASASTEPGSPSTDDDASGSDPASDPAVADVLAVEVTGRSGAYDFAVTLRSPDTGCDRYADWWEVLDAEGTLLVRRILAHSHVDEQPFTRSGGPIDASADAELWVRAHMHGQGTTADGYGGQVLHGSPRDGFAPMDATELLPLHEQPPLPDGCAF